MFQLAKTSNHLPFKVYCILYLSFFPVSKRELTPTMEQYTTEPKNKLICIYKKSKTSKLTFAL